MILVFRFIQPICAFLSSRVFVLPLLKIVILITSVDCGACACLIRAGRAVARPDTRSRLTRTNRQTDGARARFVQRAEPTRTGAGAVNPLPPRALSFGVAFSLACFITLAGSNTPYGEILPLMCSCLAFSIANAGKYRQRSFACAYSALCRVPNLSRYQIKRISRRNRAFRWLCRRRLSS